jgi:hypothetical protein
MKSTKEYNWNGQDGYRYFLAKLAAETFGEKVGYELIRIETSSNLQRGHAILDTRFGRKIQDDNGILETAVESAPANIKRILNRFAK